jgi:hypothetical protein
MASIEVLDSDITTLQVDAIANAANTQLRHGGGDVRRHLDTGSTLARVVFAVPGDAAREAFEAALA